MKDFALLLQSVLHDSPCVLELLEVKHQSLLCVTCKLWHLTKLCTSAI